MRNHSCGGSVFSQNHLRFESLEDRRMLASMADIVFLMDLSGSNENGPAFNWLRNEVFASSTGQPNPIVQALADKGISEQDIRYGLVGFGASGTTSNGFAHSYIIDSSAVDPLLGTAAQLDAAFDKVAFGLNREDGWDAIEHVVAEYSFREGAVPVVVLMQNDEGRVNLNKALTRDGILAALQSKNVILNSFVVGQPVEGVSAGTHRAETADGRSFEFEVPPLGAPLAIRKTTNDNVAIV